MTDTIKCVRCQQKAVHEVVCEICNNMIMHCCAADLRMVIEILNEHTLRFHPLIHTKLRKGRIEELRVKAIRDALAVYDADLLAEDFVKEVREILSA